MFTIICIIGWILAIVAVIEILKWDMDLPKKLIVAILVWITNWIGLAVYYFWGRENLPKILK